MTELFCSSTRYYITIISGGAIRGSVVVSFCFARCPSAITQKLDFTGFVTEGGENKPQILIPQTRFAYSLSTFMKYDDN